MPKMTDLMSTSRSSAKPNVIRSPEVRTTRMLSTMRPSVLPLVRAIITGA